MAGQHHPISTNILGNVVKMAGFKRVHWFIRSQITNYIEIYMYMNNEYAHYDAGL